MKQLLPFQVGYESYALELNEIQEVVEQQRIDPFPGAPAAVAGAISFHGRIVPVVSLPEMLKFPTARIGSRLIVLVNERGPLALGVDRVGSIISLEPADYKPVENYGEREFICEVVNWKGKMLGLLDLDKVSDELAQLCEGVGG